MINRLPATITNCGDSHTNVVRLEISIYPPPFGVAQFRLTQGTNVITHDVNGDTVLVFDVGP